MKDSALLDLLRQSTGVSTDSRMIKKGQLFFALKGPNFDGNQHAKDAIQKGALAAIVDNPKYSTSGECIIVDDVLQTLQNLARVYRDQFDIPILGITGTNGKTTSKEIMVCALSPSFKVWATQGNYNNHIGVPLTILNAPSDTEFIILEMGTNGPGDIEELCQIGAPNHGIITNIGAGHLEKLINLQGVLNEKRALFDCVNDRESGIFFMNLDDPYLNQLLEEVTDCIGYRVNDTPAGEIIWDQSDTPFLHYTLQNDDVSLAGCTQLTGDYNRSNIAAAITIADYFAVPITAIVKGIASYCPSNMRSELRETEHNTVLLDAYNANPSSVKAAILSFSQTEAKHKKIILGDMLELGEDSLRWHQEILDLIKEWSPENVILIGQYYTKLKGHHWRTFPSVALALTDAVFDEWREQTILIKGSRGIGLEKLMSRL